MKHVRKCCIMNGWSCFIRDYSKCKTAVVIMRTITLVVLAVTSTLFTTWHFMSQKKRVRRVEVFPWSTVKPMQVPEIWRDTGGGLNNQILKQFVLQNSHKLNFHKEEAKKEKIIQLAEHHISSKKEEKLVSKSIQPTTMTDSCPKGPIIAAEDGGRLGNKAWEYAAVWSLSKLLNRPGYVPSSMLNYLSHVFQNLTLKTLESISHCKLNFTLPLKRYQLMPLKNLSHKYSNKNLLLHKWMLLPEPTLKYRDQLRKEFKFLPALLKLAQNTFNNITINNYNNSKNITYIGVHVRRTDFKSWLPLKYNVKLINGTYFLDAMAWFRKKLKSESLLFLIVSDDPVWCKNEILSHVKDAILVSTKNTSPGQDLALFSSCNHTIIDYGTFGEWGAFLSRGITVSFGVDKYFNEIARRKLNWKIWKLH